MEHTELQGTYSESTFVTRAGIELKRAERYRVFVSIVVLDLKGLQAQYGESIGGVVYRLLEMVRKHTRACDYVALLETGTIGLLFPETSRQGAETAGRRIADLVRGQIERETQNRISEVIPLEMVSYPDAAGAKTITDFINDLATHRWN